MADFNGTVLTDKGRNLLSKSLTGTTLQFTKVALGDGVWDSSVNPENLDDLVSKKIDLPINNLSVTGDGTAVLRFVLTNTGLTNGFFTREIGIYANDPDLGEILYAVTYSDNPDFIPSDGVVKIENVTDIYTVVSNAQDVTAVISDTVVIATKDDVKSLSGVDDSLILEKLKNVDGNGSGLDADLIRGLPADFTNSLDTNGYHKLPSGMIIQWGVIDISGGDASGNVSITFPIDFPTSLFGVSVGSLYDGSYGDNSSYNFHTEYGSTGGFSFYYNGASTNWGHIKHMWIAIGY